MAGLQAAFEQKKPLKAFNVFRGVPISYEAKVEMLTPGYLVVRVHHFQAVCIALDHHTYLRSEFLPGVVQANCMSISVGNEEALLNQFTLAEVNVGKRVMIRVEPRLPLPVEVVHGGQRFLATVADISQKGIGVYTFGRYVEAPQYFRRGEAVELNFSLPLVDQKVKARGKITKITNEMGYLLQRLGVQTLPDPATDTALLGYLFRRKAEIMQELDRIFQDMKRAK